MSKEQNDNGSQRLKPFAITSLDEVGTAIEIRPREKDEVFATTGQKVTLSVLIKRIPGPNGKFLYEDFYPIQRDLVPELDSHIRLVTFHGCHSLKGEFFIYPQKNNSRAYTNSWNTSLKKALQAPSGTYITLDVNSQMETYEANNYEGTTSPPPSFDEFEQSLSDALSQNIITSIEHPLAQALLK